jgi:hypothetical protein
MAICHLNMQFLCKKAISFSASSNIIKGTVSRDFLLLVFFMNQFPPSSRVFHLDRFEFFRKFAEIFASQGAPPVSTTPVAKLPPVSTTPVANLSLVSATPVANFSTIFASVVDTGGKFATGVANTGGKFATGVVDTGGNFAYQQRRWQISTGINDTGGKFAAGITQKLHVQMANSH